MKATFLKLTMLLWVASSSAHEWHRHDEPQFGVLRPITEAERAIMVEEKLALAENSTSETTVAQRIDASSSSLASAFAAFAPKVRTRTDERWFYVESDGLPAHNMMVGITAWQQQVPLPQPYVGANAWRIPLQPVASKNPVSIRGRFLRGAIALAANGIPIFNPQNNRGEISAEIGELDQWGGHCGRADDYHYHAAPLHLQSVLGQSLPIAFALDGYPIYGLTEPDGSAIVGLDAFNGHETAALGYHYHGSTKYPYVNGGFHGEVVEAGGQVDPQPRAQPVRQDQPPLRGARITGFTNSPDQKTFALQYAVNGRPASVNYSTKGDGLWNFHFTGTDGSTRDETYRAGESRGGGGPDGEPRRDRRGGGQRGGRESGSAQAAKNGFTLRSSEVTDGGALPVEFTGHGSAATLPLEWSGAPAGTKSFALMMHHLDPEGRTKWYWTLYNIPADVTRLPKNATGIGTLGNNSINGHVGYAPPHSKGPGAKTYVLTLYALSSPLNIDRPPSEVSRDVLLAAMNDSVLASADLRVVYTREGNGLQDGRPPRRREATANAEPPARFAAQNRPPNQAPPRRDDQRPAPGAGRGVDSKGLIKPTMADTMKVNVYADNWFIMYINGKLRAVDSIEFTPHNVVSVDLLPEYPMTVAIMAKDNADPKTGLEYGDHIGDGGFIIKFADGTVSDAKWRAKSFFKGPLNHDVQNPKVAYTSIPTNWFAVNFDDSAWSRAVEYTQERVNPKEPFYRADFSGAKFIWTDDLDLDNTVIFRTRVEKPGWKPRWNTRTDLDVSGAPWR